MERLLSSSCSFVSPIEGYWSCRGFWDSKLSDFLRIGCVRDSPQTILVNQCYFFSPWKPKVCVKAIFGTFCHFFHGCKIIFTHAFLTFFTGSPDFSRTRSKIFSRVGIFFSRAEKWKFSRVGILFSRTEIGLSPMVEDDLDFDLS